ncbi:MAG: hypothetical protein OHK0017_04580 [Patescibacteria group bacterium]
MLNSFDSKPKENKPAQNKFQVGQFIHGKTSLIVVASTLVLSLLVTTGVYLFAPKSQQDEPGDKNNPINVITGTPNVFALEKFNSCDSLYSALEQYAKDSYANGYTISRNLAEDNKGGTPAAAPTTGSSNVDYSGTNNQVEGVDEGDIVKTDGNFVYTVNGRNVNITEVNPNTGILTSKSKIALASEVPSINSLNLYKDKLVIIGGFSGRDQTRIFVYDISNKATPKLDRELRVDGYGLETRMVNGVVYLVSNYYNYDIYPFYLKPEDTKESQKESYRTQLESKLPKLYDSLNSDQGEKPLVRCQDLNYIKPIPGYNFVNLISLDLKDVKGNIGREVIMGNTQTVYASENNIYLAQPNYNYFYTRRNKDWKETTTIFKFNVDGSKINYQAAGEVEGTILNQFSMDEFEQNLRVATHKQAQYYSGPNIPLFGPFVSIPTGGSSTEESNSIYVLDKDMKPLGSLTGLAPNERIYSARFMGKRGYMVTFKKVDPLFTFDLSDPKNPKVLGQLKIPGYSDYLHPIDENTLIGVGKNTIEAADAYGDDLGFAWYQGLKIGLFDVSDMSKPQELAKVEIGDRGTDSAVLQDHKAFLYDSRNKLLVLPVTLMIIPDDQKARTASEFPGYGSFKYQGSYIYNVTREKGFQLKGRVSHIETKAKGSVTDQVIKKLDEFGQVIETTTANPGSAGASVNGSDGNSSGGSSSSPSKPSIAPIPPDYGNSDYLYYIKRQMYINQYLITVSDKQIQSNKIEDLKLVNNLSF